jgi:hypothetical protein
LDERGFTAEVAAQRLSDGITEFVRGANARMKGTDIELQSDEPNIIVPAVNVTDTSAKWAAASPIRNKP